MTTTQTSASIPSLTEDSIDDILYLARTNDATELSTLVIGLASTYNTPEASVLAAAVDSETKNTPLHYAAANGHVETLTSLLSILASASDKSLLNPRNASKNTPLHWAALNGHLTSVQALVRAGADAALLNAAGHDCVYEAELNDKGEVVEWLLREAVGLEEGVVGREGEAADAEGDDQEEDENKEAGESSESVDVNGRIEEKMKSLDVNGNLNESERG